MSGIKRKKIVIAGGGTAGWIVAAALVSQLRSLVEVILVESDAIGTVGVGEATIPTHCSFHRMIGIDEKAFMKATNATFKLGISFENWGQLGERYFHGFGKVGNASWAASFENVWQAAAANGYAHGLDDFCLELKAANEGRFGLSSEPRLNYAYHLDATAYAKFLRSISEARGVLRKEGKILDVITSADTGFIQSLKLDSGEKVEGDFFVDCTGFRGLLIDQALGVQFQDWSEFLPMNSAWAVQTLSTIDPPPYTRAIARSSGWQWRIPLQHRTGNGLVFCDKYSSEEDAKAELLANLTGEMITKPRLIKFTTGIRNTPWEKNCLAVGLSSGFMEPLESTSIHLIQIAATRLVQFFPFDGNVEALSSHYNRYMLDELKSIRDFLVLHYKLTRRDDSQFWRERQTMPIPESLQRRLDLYTESGILYQNGEDLFRTDSWVQVMRGQGFSTNAYHNIGHLMSRDQLHISLDKMRTSIAKCVQSLPSHKEFIDAYCRADS